MPRKRKGQERQELTIEGRTVPVSNPEKVLYPESAFTKAQVIDYYVRIAQHLLPHLKDRPVTLKRYPDGVQGEAFHEKDAPAFAPDWVQTFPVPRRAGGADIEYILINDLPTLVWCANAASLELHPFLHSAREIEQPTSVVFDLDPGEGADLLTCAEVGFLVRDLLLQLGLKTYPKVSGSKGIQLYVPLNQAVTYAITQPFAHTVARLLAEQHPALIVSEMAKALRTNKVFIDWSQNSDYKTTVGVYSLRAKRETPYVSLPVTWDELERALRARDADALHFEPEAALKRVLEMGDLFAPVLTLKQSLPESFVANIRTSKPTVSRVPSPQPEPKIPRASGQGSRKRFVVQKHAASHLHYDFRLEIHGVLKSWAVPKGVPYEVEERRSAMATEDHPIEYLSFEGTIPQGQYGGGTVMVWDIGTYEVVGGNYWKGDLTVYLRGKKLNGEWRLIKDGGDKKHWALVKSESSMKALSAKQETSRL